MKQKSLKKAKVASAKSVPAKLNTFDVYRSLQGSARTEYFKSHSADIWRDAKVASAKLARKKLNAFEVYKSLQGSARDEYFESHSAEIWLTYTMSSIDCSLS